MPPIISLGTWNERGERAKLKPKARCFIVAEGSNTEYWYLSHLASVLSKKNLPERIEIRTIEKTGPDKGKSHPRALAELASQIRTDPEGAFGFDTATDRVIMVFDTDTYKGDHDAYEADLVQFKKLAQVAVTNPSFELFLLLHKENAISQIIEPHRDAILANGYYEGTRRRYISKLANDALGMNLKKNPNVALLAEKFDLAAQQERQLNQNPNHAIDDLTSNVALVIENLLRDGASQA